MAIPIEIKKHRPTEFGASEVRLISGHYYVYLISSVWDREKKRAKKKTGECIGKITEHDGFIPNDHYLRPKTPLKAYVTGYGVYELFIQISPEIIANLRAEFPDVYREILVISLLRLSNRFSAKNAKQLFEASYLHYLYPDMSMSPSTVSRFMTKLGDRREEMVNFMSHYRQKGQKLLFDGTNIFSHAAASYAQKGYNPSRRQETQIRLLYVFDKESFAPIFYRLLPGNIVDKASLIATIKELGCADVLIIGDKGFYTKKNVSYLMENNLRFILPLQSNTKLIDNKFAENSDRRKFDGVFIYHNRQIWYKKEKTGENGNHLYIFLDEGRRQKEETHYLEKLNEGYDDLTQEGFFDNKRRGLFAFVSNLDTDSKEIYLEYKSRWDIEQCFDSLKNTLKIGAPYQRSNEQLQAWAFLNHVSLLFFYSLVKSMKSSGLDASYSPEDIIDMCKNIMQVKYNHRMESLISEVPERVLEILTQLGVDILRKN